MNALGSFVLDQYVKDALAEAGQDCKHAEVDDGHDLHPLVARAFELGLKCDYTGTIDFGDGIEVKGQLVHSVTDPDLAEDVDLALRRGHLSPAEYEGIMRDVEEGTNLDADGDPSAVPASLRARGLNEENLGEYARVSCSHSSVVYRWRYGGVNRACFNRGTGGGPSNTAPRIATVSTRGSTTSGCTGISTRTAYRTMGGAIHTSRWRWRSVRSWRYDNFIADVFGLVAYVWRDCDGDIQYYPY